MTSGEKSLTRIEIFSLVAGIIGLIVDVVALVQIFGIDLIISPSRHAEVSGTQPLVLRVPDAEVITFLVWLYVFIATIIGAVLVLRKAKTRLIRFAPMPFCALTPALFAVWLWGFGYLSKNTYVSFLAGLAFFGISCYSFALAMRNRTDSQTALGIGVTWLLAFSFTLVWYRSGYEERFLMLIGRAFATMSGGALLPLFVTAMVDSKLRRKRGNQ